MTDQNFSRIIDSSWHLLCSFYDKKPNLEITDFIKFNTQLSPQVLVQENHDAETLYIAVIFPENMRTEYETTGHLSLQTLSAVCEEMSHFFHLSSAAEREAPISIFHLEALAEIDRFISFLHWNTFHPELALSESFNNCHQVCDALFERRIFSPGTEELYGDAESIALHHLRRAFAHCWTQQYFDSRNFDPNARRYIADLFQQGHPVLISA